MSSQPSEKTIKIRAMKNMKKVLMKEISDYILLISKAMDSAIDSDHETLFFYIGDISRKLVTQMDNDQDKATFILSLPPFTGQEVEIPLGDIRSSAPDVYAKIYSTAKNFLEVYDKY